MKTTTNEIKFISKWKQIRLSITSNSKLPPTTFQGPNWYDCYTSILKEQTLEIVGSSTFGCIPIDVWFARIIPSSRW